LEAFEERGKARHRSGDYDGAIADYTRAIELDPKFSQAYYNLGLAKKHKGDMDGAIADYSTAIRFAPALALAYMNSGLAYLAAIFGVLALWYSTPEDNVGYEV